MGVLLDQVDAAYDELRQLSCDEVGSDFRLVIAERLENQQRANRGLMYLVFSQIADPPDGTGMAVGIMDRLWARLRIPPREIKRRFKLAKRICPRRQLAGPPLPADLAEVGAAVERGLLGEDHLKAICTALDRLPANVSVTDRDDVQASLVRQAVKGDADIVTAVGRRIDEIFNPDGHFSEEDRARRRGLRLGPQDCDGMSRLSGWIDPETRCYVEAISAAVRPNCLAPGYHSEVHHSTDWAAGGTTDADTLFFACGPDHKQVTEGRLHTVVTPTGRLAWTDGTTAPAINHAHHPDELLHNNTDPPDREQSEKYDHAS